MVSAVLADRGFDRVSREQLVAAAHDAGALDEARALAERYAEQARQDLAGFEPSRHREALMTLPDFILARDH
jgi:octaprenyl-diphosphate synthase